jgi:tyrosine-protein kinase Etk/Wzc
MPNNKEITSVEQLEDNSSMFLKLLYRYLFNHWKWFVLCILFAMPIAYFYLYYSIPKYQVSSTLLIEDPDSEWKDQSTIEELDLFNETKNIDNEIGIIRSIGLNERVLFNAGLYYDVYNHGKYRTKEIYNVEPFNIIIDSSHVQSMNLDFYIDILSENEYTIYTEDITNVQTYNYSIRKVDKNVILPQINRKASFGEMLITEGFSFKILLNEKFHKSHVGRTYHFVFHDLNDLAKSYSSKLQIKRITEDATLVVLSIKHTLPNKAKTYLNALSKEYVELGLREKNETATRTINFIDNMLKDLTDSLSLIENDLQGFRTENQVMDLSFEAKNIYNELSELEKEKAKEQVKLRYYYYLENYISTNDSINKIIAPSTIGIDDPLLNILIQELINLYNDRSQLLISSTDANPYYKVLNGKISNTKKALLENVKNIINSSKLILSETNNRILEFKAEANKLPETERKLINIERKFTVNDQIYTYLLERRAEAAIAKASNTADNKIIDRANLDGKTFPNSRKVYIMALFLAILIPGVFFSLKYLLKNKISTRDDISSRTDIPIAGLLSHSKFETTEIVFNYPKSIITESLRTLKTNLNFFQSKKNIQTILFTSTISGEGKTFLSINMAAMYAISKQKVILINADLRKPSIEKSLSVKNRKNVGLSNVLSNNCTWDESVVKYQKEGFSFDILPSGPIPPNPGEMLDSISMSNLMKELKKSYDIIIIDSPPVGIIADSLNLIKYCDKVLYIFKHNYSFKNSVRLLNEISSSSEKKDAFAVIINDVTTQYSLNYSSYNSYKYGRGGNYKYHGYYGKYTDEDSEKENLIKRINQFLSTK